MIPAWLAPSIVRLTNAATSASGVIAGCTVDEIANLQRRYGVALPSAYRAMLMSFGCRADGFLDRDEFDFYYDQLLRLNDKLRDAHSPWLPPNGFVIRARHFEQFEFILREGGDDSDVYLFNADQSYAVAVFSSLRD